MFSGGERERKGEGGNISFIPAEACRDLVLSIQHNFIEQEVHLRSRQTDRKP